MWRRAMRNLLNLGLLMMSCLILNPASPLQAADPHITMEIGCQPNNNTVRIINHTDRYLSLEGWTLSSLAQPGPYEPYSLHDPAIQPEGWAYFLNGASKDRVLGGIRFKELPNEGARLGTPYGTLDVLCSNGVGSLPVTFIPGMPNTGAGGAQEKLSSWWLILPIGFMAMLLVRGTRQRNRQRQ